MAFDRPSSRPHALLDDLSHDAGLYALFVDFDGTIVDIATTPDRVFAPPGLVNTLSVLSVLLDGALAVVSGRPIADLDLRLQPFRGRAAGIHGAEVRVDSDAAPIRQADDLDAQTLADVRRLTGLDSRIFIEDKGASVAVHYRLAEEFAPSIERKLTNYAAARGLALMRGRKVYEILRQRVSKGGAVSHFMQMPAFAGRRPIMIGDDRTDLSAFEACATLGGLGLSVAGELFPIDESDFTGPAAVRLWLAEFAARLLTLQEIRA